MSRVSNPVKVQEWSDRLKRYQRSGETVARFCRKEGISGPSFYQWKKRLTGESNTRQAKLISGSAQQHVQTRRRQVESPPTSSRFQSVELLPVPSSSMTIRFPNGIEIELGSDLRVMDMLVKRLLEQSTDLEAGW